MSMEQLEIHSKSYLVRWVKVAGDHTISWTVQPHKKSINFGLFKHPGGNVPTPHLPATSTFEGSLPNGSEADGHPAGKVSARQEGSTAVEKLQSVGLKMTLWVGKCEADKVSMGRYDVPAEQGGMYALLFDNTFSKQVSKTATFVLLTYPTNAPPQTTHHLHHRRAHPEPNPNASTSTLASKRSPTVEPRRLESTDSLYLDGSSSSHAMPLSAQPPTPADEKRSANAPTFYTGVLHKRRRKRHQGFAKRFFSLDFTSSTLSYYHDRRSSALRGAIPLALAAVGTNERSREIIIDSGAEVWHLRATNQKDFEGWKHALEKAAKSAVGLPLITPALTLDTSRATLGPLDGTDDRDWARIETLVGRVAGTRDAVRRLAISTASKGAPSPAGLGLSASSVEASPLESSSDDYFKDKRPFWKRKPSSSPSIPALLKRSAPSARTSGLSTPGSSGPNGTSPHAEEHSMHGHCTAILSDLDAVVADFSALITETKRRRMVAPRSAVSHRTVDSSSTADFFDAEAGEMEDSTLLVIPDADEDHPSVEQNLSDGEGSRSSTDGDTREDFGGGTTADKMGSALFPSKPKSLSPLPLDPVRRRTSIPPASATPPSLIGILRKNVGKDLSTISMPVASNEPTSLLQRCAEYLEYSALLNAAVHAGSDDGERVLYMAAFAISSFACNRVKERAIRKPFNPLLGETYELVREDLGFRFLAEKVSHRPVRMATQAESEDWTFTHSPMPTQKFWGKSAELNTEGRVRVVLHATRERFSWTAATCFLRNIIAGEKYVEPVGSMTIANETTGQKAIVIFKPGGMFSGRSEDVTVQAFSATGERLPLGLSGRWTSSLALTNEVGTAIKTIWRAGSLVDQATTRYGLTTLAASLNEITPIEQDRLPATDSRLRPDQRMAETGDITGAERLKTQLEDAQRSRRKQMETQGEAWQPRWFERVDVGVKRGDGGGVGGDRADHGSTSDEEVWRLKSGRDGYWEERQAGSWTRVVDIFDP
ncbi:MAG: hypothetical protein M1838_003991 [Thelocarpon superellum]|nr:MAG: hypothetical protein M1838_003991 [Thelocarpon superellum]